MIVAATFIVKAAISLGIFAVVRFVYTTAKLKGEAHQHKLEEEFDQLAAENAKTVEIMKKWNPGKIIPTNNPKENPYLTVYKEMKAQKDLEWAERMAEENLSWERKRKTETPVKTKSITLNTDRKFKG